MSRKKVYKDNMVLQQNLDYLGAPQAFRLTSRYFHCISTRATFAWLRISIADGDSARMFAAKVGETHKKPSDIDFGR